MEPQTNPSPLIVILGETSSGKSELAMKLAQQFKGEIIAADSRTIYKGMDIGTAKPNAADRKLVPHHLLDIAAPDHSLTVADFQKLADEAIKDISSRHKLPFLVGGAGLYIDSVVFGYQFSGQTSTGKRAEFQNFSIKDLQAQLVARGIPLPRNFKNPRHLIRQLETGGVTSGNNEKRGNSLLLGTQIKPLQLQRNIEQRTENMFEQGLAKEAITLLRQYGPDCPALQTIGYKEFRSYLDGNVGLDYIKQAIIHDTLQYTKRQRTWFKRHKSIIWICKVDEAVDLITTFLNKLLTT
jgi:tRNA dimethylallyltransferase